MRPAAAVLLAFFVLVAGLSCGRAFNPAPMHEYVIESHNWNTTTVSFFCGGQALRREHNLRTGERRPGRVNLSNCNAPEYVVTFVGSPEVVRSGPIHGWTRDVILIIIVENATQLSTYRLAAA